MLIFEINRIYDVLYAQIVKDVLLAAVRERSLITFTARLVDDLLLQRIAVIYSGIVLFIIFAAGLYQRLNLSNFKRFNKRYYRLVADDCRFNSWHSNDDF